VAVDREGGGWVISDSACSVDRGFTMACTRWGGIKGGVRSMGRSLASAGMVGGDSWQRVSEAGGARAVEVGVVCVGWGFMAALEI
jgi:hypothetical protein